MTTILKTEDDEARIIWQKGTGNPQLIWNKKEFPGGKMWKSVETLLRPDTEYPERFEPLVEEMYQSEAIVRTESG